MGTMTQTPARAGEVKLEYGRAETVAFKFLTGKNFEGTFGMRVLFTLSDDRRLWVDAEDGSDIDHRLQELGVRAGEPVKLTKIRHPRGGGHSIRIERVEDNAAPASVTSEPASPLEAKLTRSLEVARTEGPQAFQRNAHVVPAEASAPAQTDDTARRLMGCFCAAIDAIAEAQAYADKKGVKVAFTSEDLRAVAITAFIQTEKAALTVRY
jgi:hypothetical protein